MNRTWDEQRRKLKLPQFKLHFKKLQGKCKL